jgi:hypothetical protein
MPEQSKPSKVTAPITPAEFEVALLKLKGTCEGLCYGEGHAVLQAPSLTRSDLVRWTNLIAGSSHALDMLLYRFAMAPPAFPRSTGELQADQHTPVDASRCEGSE